MVNPNAQVKGIGKKLCEYSLEITKKNISEVTKECVDMTLAEYFVLEKVNEGRTIIGLYPPTDEKTLIDFESWKKRK